MMQLYFIRHGESEANILGEFSNHGWKHPLTPLGVQQAQTLAQQLADCAAGGRRVARIYSSPVMRAVQTAEILSIALQVEMELAEPLREWSVGIFEGRRDEAGWLMHRQVQEDWFEHNRPESKMPGGENLHEIRARFLPFLQALIEKHAPAGEDLALVAHGGLYRAMLPEVFKNLTRDLLARLIFPNCGYVLGEIRSDGLYCLEWCGAPVPG